MTNEEFYKNLALKAIGLYRDEVCGGAVNNNFPEADIEWQVNPNGQDRVINIKRKLILKEKTWYLTKNGDNLFTIGFKPEWLNHSQRLVCVNSTGYLFTFLLDGQYYSDRPSSFDLDRECTPEEVKDIEDKLREENNDNE